ncbi:MAG TPA: phosphotransferase family protein [Acidimicrobiales bacterium]|nr:phosphotransferase family protein [Acidimicrobiales bacterium]
MRGEELEAALTARLGGEVTGLRRMSGGASRETWSFALDGERLILRRDPVGSTRTGGMLREAALLRAAAEAGVPVPRLIDASDDPSVVGSAFLVMAHVDGETIPRKILRDPEYAGARPLLARQCGEVLAKLHAIPLDQVPGLEDQDQLVQYRAVLDGVDQPHPAFELAFRWLEANRPGSTRRTVVHGDFRNGNVIVGPAGLRAVLDWELAHTGDPMEDLGWLCVKSWRFGVALPVGGFGTYDELVGGYGEDVDRDALRWWEILGTLKWGIMCIMQAVTHTSGAVRSVELAAIGRRVCEVELDLLEVLP